MIDTTELPQAAPGDVIRLLGLPSGPVFVRMRERTTRGLVVNFTGVLKLVTGRERRDDGCLVVDVDQVEPWQLPKPRAPRPQREAT